ncbi:hypothetical protein D7I44_10365 [Gryllotalpicola protaetiae]|uniref:TfoX N-terminal domain-containing protein n=2 Tax=Gryllotalpicola protaetiae TaxID=2419771 RepID=A0A387BS60_9MICO|nr:hypothetical protein D7I44_10365 [Gryllotalpicola protaetiae]
MTADQAFDLVTASLSDMSIREGRMFGCRTLLSGRKMFAVLYDRRLAVRLGRGSQRMHELASSPAAEEWDPTRRHQPFRDWALVSFELHDEWPDLARVAYEALP